jgi:hypothetical protein
MAHSDDTTAASQPVTAKKKPTRQAQSMTSVRLAATFLKSCLFMVFLRERIKRLANDALLVDDYVIGAEDLLHLLDKLFQRVAHSQRPNKN